MNKKQALQNGYMSTGESGTDWDEMLVKVEAARNGEHHARLITERVCPLLKRAPAHCRGSFYLNRRERRLCF
jgi:hypothetical protein